MRLRVLRHFKNEKVEYSKGDKITLFDEDAVWLLDNEPGYFEVIPPINRAMKSDPYPWAVVDDSD